GKRLLPPTRSPCGRRRGRWAGRGRGPDRGCWGAVASPPPEPRRGSGPPGHEYCRLSTIMEIGFLYPGHSAEDDYPTAQTLLSEGAGPDAAPGPELRGVHTEMAVDAHRVAALREIGADRVLAEGVRELGPVSSVIWACTSGSFVFGWDGASSQVGAL